MTGAEPTYQGQAAKGWSGLGEQSNGFFAKSVGIVETKETDML